jgi:hypothetical protein
MFNKRLMKHSALEFYRVNVSLDTAVGLATRNHGPHDRSQTIARKIEHGSFDFDGF